MARQKFPPYEFEGAIEAKFKDGIRHGLYKEYYNSGALLIKAKYKNGKQEGLWKEYDESGKVKGRNINYKNGERIK